MAGRMSLEGEKSKSEERVNEGAASLEGCSRRRTKGGLEYKYGLDC